MKKKEKIFLRFNLNMKDYNEELEIILDQKKFSEEAQNLILNMFYRIENSYTDYHNVKRQTPTKEKFIQNIISYIYQYCNNIELIKPKGKKNEIEYIIDKENGEIQCFPNESILLYCLIQLINLDNDLDNETLNIREKAINEMLEIGNSLNYQEVIRDFNGWSWADSLVTTQELQYNLAFQNLLLIIGDEKLQKILNYTEKLSILKQELDKKYETKLVNNFLYAFSEVAVLLKANKDKKYKIELKNYFEPLIQELQQISDKEQLIVYITSKRKDITDEIGEIDKRLNNIIQLREEFDERNKSLAEDKKIFSISALAEMYEEKRANLLEQMKTYNKLVEPMEYLKKKEELTNEVEFYKKLQLKENKTNSIDKHIINLQELFLKCFKEKIIKCSEKREIMNLIYDFRYYWLLNYKKGYKIRNATKLKNLFQQVLNELINKAQELRMIERISDDNLCNIKILGKILQSKIITLENVVLQIFDEGEEYRIQYYDGNVLEGEFEIKLNDINIKKKRTKLFI